MASWIQLHEEDMEGAFQEIGFVKVGRDTFADEHRILFRDRDSNGHRGALGYAVVELSSGDQFFLQHEPGLAETGVWLYAKASGDARRQCDEFAAAFAIDPAEILPFRAD
ncbi:MAG TPA: hypothetical protein VHX62_00410 [Solirubrobacteraceae bacterium]|jgi:hypothetical protein|nr:hypothetical protein [Solirubrobacteraceae bacterium]